MVEELKKEVRAKMEKSLEALRHELSQIRTGRASPALLDAIRVEYYGTMVPITHIANVSAPEARLLVVQPWDKSTLPAIEKAILSSDLGITPSNDGNVIRLSIPPLTEERRQELVKVVRRLAEDARVAVRNIRREAVERLRKAQKDGELSEDESRRAQKEVQEITDEYIKKVGEALAQKEAEILEE
ncbi:MAG: ribosome recycling factor [Candidatus Latescibacterota bacterium]|nr:MAG: ribosome recycling factor [Candidatus Latescibacterota bacterium]RKY63346.1 MAG: ribosome recycling factor [Candidatus Latescibacterota bacterium]RKY74662.1 MAG: ribosome recycling factor [Candidatus Latescibacterota bacterium]HDH99361.1 ribosome recycling factor [Bacillota bacterium]